MVISDLVWQAIIGGIVTIVLGYLQLLGAIKKVGTEAKADAAHVAGKVEQAATVVTGQRAEIAAHVEAVAVSLQNSTDTKLDSLAKVARETHVLVNNNMAIQLRLNMELSAWKAAQTGNAEDERSAQLAASLYADHMAMQKRLDALQQRGRRGVEPGESQS